MTFTAADPVSSGRPYRVILVGGRQPTSIDEFAGTAITITVAVGKSEHLITGDGASHDDHIRFHEKDSGGGKDVRIWHIAADQGGSGFTASSAHH